MTIDFSQMEEKDLLNFKGGEKSMHTRMFTDENNKIMLSYLEPGASIGLHTHEGNSEVIYILEGEGTVIDDKDKKEIKQGEATYCPMGHAHSLINTSDSVLRFFAVVSEHAKK